jgi:hypothetical protein
MPSCQFWHKRRQAFCQREIQARVCSEDTLDAPSTYCSLHCRGQRTIEGAGNESKYSGCQFWIVRKQKYCPLPKRGKSLFCTIHGGADDATYVDEWVPDGAQTTGKPACKRTGRIPCPYGGNHSVRFDRVKRHLNVCSEKPPVDQR